LKKEFAWNKKDPLHFWQSLAFTLRSADLTHRTCVAVSSFVDTMGQNKLYIACNDPMTSSQQQEVTEIIIMYLDLKPLEEIAAKLLPRHLPYIIKQFRKCVSPFMRKLPNSN
jgi:dimeric dUTPase (all-alpha-NTP-PPase superfamily)